MDYSTTAKQLLGKLGGEKNIISVTHCMTRLRFVLKDEYRFPKACIGRNGGSAGRGFCGG